MFLLEIAKWVKKCSDSQKILKNLVKYGFFRAYFCSLFQVSNCLPKFLLDIKPKSQGNSLLVRSFGKV